MKAYRHANWVKFRDDVIKLHSRCCARCGRSSSEGAVLQVHHRRYIQNRQPWEYDVLDCEALCKGCHAAEHGIVLPAHGWIWMGVDDLGEMAGNCELCGTGIRYVHAVQHCDWRSLAVGTECCDKLTGTLAASEHLERHSREVEARKRFVDSKRWKLRADGGSYIRDNGIFAVIFEIDEKFLISIDHVHGKRRFDSLISAKIELFQLLKSGKAQEFLAKRRLRSQRSQCVGHRPAAHANSAIRLS